MKPLEVSTIAVDVGNSRLKFGLFAPQLAIGLPIPSSTLTVSNDEAYGDAVLDWLKELAGPHAWWIASVNRPAATQFLQWVAGQESAAETHVLDYLQLPLQVDVATPERVGLDRLCSAVAANAVRSNGEPAIVVDAGSAVTVDLISTEGVFQGGAILPGMALAARSLHSFTDLLPDVALPTTPPSVLGKSTVEAMAAGLYWGTLGAVKEVVSQLQWHSAVPARVILTGGGASILAPALKSAQHVPHLVLSGIALAAAKAKQPVEVDE